MKGARLQRVGEEIRQVLSQLLISRVEDPRLRALQVTRVEVSPDLAHAKVYISTLGGEEAQEAALKAASRAASYLRSELARSVHMRRVPVLSFKADAGIRYSVHLQQVFQELGLEEEGGLGAAEDEESDAQGGPDPRAEEEEEER